MKNANDPIGNRTRDLPACSRVPQSTVRLCIPVTEVAEPNPAQRMTEKVDKIMEFMLEQREVGRRVSYLKNEFSSEQCACVLKRIKRKKKPEYRWKNRGRIKSVVNCWWMEQKDVEELNFVDKWH